MNNRIKDVVSFYALCSKLKDTIRKGPLTWNANRERIESVAEHIYGVQMLAISIYYQFDYKLDLNKIIYMLAIHELEEIEIGDLAFYEITKEEKLANGKKATNYILKDLLIINTSCKTINNLYHNMSTHKAKAVTVSNINLHSSVVLFNPHRRKYDYINSIIHEAEHIKQSMLYAYNVPDYGEPPAYTIGYIAMKMLMLFKHIQ